MKTKSQQPSRRNPLPAIFAAVMVAVLAPVLLAIELPGAIETAATESANEKNGMRLDVYPPSIDLSHARDRQSLVARLTNADGITSDVTGEAEWKVLNPEICRISGNAIYPVADGESEIRLTYQNLVFTIPVKTSGSANRPPLSFRNDVMPVFSKAGCNAGSCHGAARGKDGFNLSLYGFDPDGDYHRLTREQPGRRVDLAFPADCLLMTKATGAVPHTGEQLFDTESEYYRTLLEWLETGAERDSGEVPTCTSIELYPDSGLFDGPDRTQQLTVVARYSDGSDRDVTSLSYFSTGNDNSATVSPAGVVTSTNRGEAFIMARFDTHTVGSPFISLPAGLNFTWENEPENNYIDRLANDKLKDLRILPSDICSDAEFARRVYLDICGLSPTVDEVREFTADEDADKRSKLVDQLLQRKEFVDLWVMKWSELLQIRSTQQVSYKATLLYYNWIQQQVAAEVPVNEMVRDLLSSDGGTFTNPATNYYQNEMEPLKITENVAQVFMGMRIQCAQCHNHPFDRWTMDDYYGFAAFFARLGRKRAEDPREQIIFNKGNGETKHPVTKQNMAPRFLGGETPNVQGKDRRKVMADWLVSDENPYFSRNLANIVWAHFFGQGIVQEVDDVRISNPAVNQPLLDELGRKFVEYKYDFKKMIRDICNSRTYQRSTIANESNESDLNHFSHAMLRRIRAEILLDVISRITETENKFRGLPVGSRAVQIADGNTSTYFLNTFGRASRETVCSCEVKAEPNLSQALHLLNGEAVHNKVRKGKVVERMLKEGMATDQILRELFLRCLAREPNENELNGLLAEIESTDGKKQALEDVFWALLNSREFLFNH